MASETAPVALLVEDDATTRALCERTLARDGWTCRHASAQGEALAVLADDTIALEVVILDYGLPDGPPWPILVAAQSRVPQVPVIMATGMGDEQLAAECMRRGATDYIIKGGQFWDLLPQAALRARQVTTAVQDASRLSAVVEASPDPIISTDPQGRILSWNPAAVRLYGHGAERAVGNRLEFVVPADERDRFELQLARVRAGRRVRSEVRRQHASGEIIPVSCAMSPIIGGDERLVGVAIIEQDLRPRQEAIRLQQLTAQLERLNQELDHFAAVAAHDLKAPIRVASCSLDLLREAAAERLTESDSALIASAIAALRSSGEMVEKVLEYARQATVDVSADRTLSADEACSHALRNLDAEIRETGAEIEVGPLGEVCFDPPHLVRIFQNLIANAIKYARPDRPPRIAIRALDRREGDQLPIEIADNGRGMSEAEIAGLYVLFKRGREHDDTEGTGIGLAVVRKLIEARGGRIDVRSRPGEGSTFTIVLPASRKCEDHSTESSGYSSINLS